MTRAVEGRDNQGSVDLHRLCRGDGTCCKDLLQCATLHIRAWFSTAETQISHSSFRGKEKPPHRSSLQQKISKNQKKTHSDVEAQEITDHSGDSGQDDHSGEVIDQRVDGQAQQPERSIQLLVEIRGIIRFSSVFKTFYYMKHAEKQNDPAKEEVMLFTFINFVANFSTLLTTLSSSFLWGFFSILRYTFIYNHKEF